MKLSMVTMIVALALRVDSGFSMPASPFPYDVIQPDGSVITLKMNGDEYGHAESDLKGFTAVRGKDGFFYYASEDGEAGELVATEFVVGKVNPESKGLKKKAKSKAKKNCDERLCRNSKGSKGSKSGEGTETRRLRGATEDQGHRRDTSTTGTLKNLVIPIRFSDHLSRLLPSREDIDILMNHEGSHSLAPTGSVRDVFLENSYGMLTIDSIVVDWIDSDYDEETVANGDSGLTSFTWNFLKDALEKLDSQNFDFTQFDVDGDNAIDAITFLHSGYAAESSGTDQYGTSSDDRMWSHKWSIDWPSGYETWDGVRIREYHISPAVWGTSGSEIGRIGVIAHETGHFLGITDLYDTDDGEDGSEEGQGLGSWALMANSWGFDGSQKYPPHMSAWSKIRMGWLEPVEVQYGLNSISASEIDDPNHPQVIKVTHGYPQNEYLLIENRQPIGFDGKVPQGGLAIYHIDDTVDDYDTQGYPGQSGWPGNGKHYRVALLQADGDYDLERDVNRGDSGDVFHGQGKNFINSNGVSGHAHPNTNAYQDGTIITTTNQIFSISNSGTDMTFYFTNDDQPNDTASPTASPTKSPKPSSMPTDIPTQAPQMPSSSPSSEPTKFPTNAPSILPSSSPSNVPTPMPSLSQAPSASPSTTPSSTPSNSPSTSFPSESPSSAPTSFPIIECSFWDRLFNRCPEQPTRRPTSAPVTPTGQPTKEPSPSPTNTPTRAPQHPSAQPTMEPSPSPTNTPTQHPTAQPTKAPSPSPSNTPTRAPQYPTAQPTKEPSPSPSNTPTQHPTDQPTKAPSPAPTAIPTSEPTRVPTKAPTPAPSASPMPSFRPSTSPTTSSPTSTPTKAPTTPLPPPTTCSWWQRLFGMC